jgi:hypothetical protein
MDTVLFICYIMGYETTWNPRTTREAKAQSHSLTKDRPQLPLCGSSSRRLLKFCGTLVSSVPETREACTETKTNSRSTTSAVRCPEKETCQDPPTRASGSRLSDRPLDSKAHRRSDSQALRCSLHDPGSVEADEIARLELSETRETGQRTQRSRHSLLEARGLATHKKKPQSLEPTWPSLMKVVFCLYHPSDARGRFVEKHLFCLWRETGPRFRLSRQSVSRLNESTWDSTSSFTRIRTFALNRSSSFWYMFLNIFADRLSFCGTTFVPIERGRFSDCLNVMGVSTNIFSQAMLPNLILMNLCGHTSSATWRTVSLATLFILISYSGSRSVDCNVHNDSYGLVFTLLNCQGNNRIHYLVNSQ